MTINHYIKPKYKIQHTSLQVPHQEAMELFLSPTLHKVLERVKRLRLFRNLLGFSASVKLGEAPKCFHFTPALAIDYMTWHPHIQTLQLVQDALGQTGLGFIQHGARTWQRDQGQAWFRIQHWRDEFGSDVKTTLIHLNVRWLAVYMFMFLWTFWDSLGLFALFSRLRKERSRICTTNMKPQQKQGVSSA